MNLLLTRRGKPEEVYVRGEAPEGVGIPQIKKLMRIGRLDVIEESEWKRQIEARSAPPEPEAEPSQAQTEFEPATPRDEEPEPEPEPETAKKAQRRTAKKGQRSGR